MDYLYVFSQDIAAAFRKIQVAFEELRKLLALRRRDDEEDEKREPVVTINVCLSKGQCDTKATKTTADISTIYLGHPCT